jgi:hypothetical protein
MSIVVHAGLMCQAAEKVWDFAHTCPAAWPKDHKAGVIMELGQDAPQAAEMPCRVERYLVVKSSTGVTKVVAFGPKLAKKNVSAYMTMKSQMETALIWFMAAARMIRMTVMMVKPGHTCT